jgi:hypothetical protein
MVCPVFFFTAPEQFQSARCLRMRASNQNRPEERNGRDVRAPERGTGDGGKARLVADTSDGSGFAVGDAEGADALFPSALRGFDGVSQALAEADGDKEIARIERAHPTLDVAGAADRSFGGETESHKSISEIPAEGCGEIDADYQDAARFLYLFGKRDDASGIDGGLQRLEIAEVKLHVVADAVGHGALFPGGSFQNGVGSEARDEVGAEVGDKLREFAVTECLDGANDGGGVHLIAFRKFAGREVVGVFRIFQNHAKQFTAAGIELGLGAGKTGFEDRESVRGGAGDFKIIIVGLDHEFPRITSGERDLCGYGKSPAAPRANQD